MNRQEFIDTYLKFLADYNIPSTGVHTSFGGSMIMLGLRDNTSDIDLTVSQDVWDMFNHIPSVDLGEGVYKRSLPDVIDMHLTTNEIPESCIETSEGVRYRNMKQTYYDKLGLGRDKDIPDIKLLYKALRGK